MANINNPLIRKLVLGAQLSGLLGGNTALAQQSEPQAQVLTTTLTDKEKDDLTEQMFNALKNNDVEKAKALIIKGADITKDRDDIYPLTYAALTGNIEFTKWLLSKHKERGDDEEFIGKGIETSLLSFASRTGQIEYAKWTLQNGAEINVDDGAGRNALMNAADAGQKEMMQWLLDQGANINGTPNPTDITPLSIVLRKGDNETAKWLLEHGANPNGLGIKSRPFEVAMESKNAEGALLVLNKGAEAGYYEIKDATPYHDALDLGSKELFNTILKSKTAPDVNERNAGGWTALGWAATRGNYDVDSIKNLIALGADIKNLDAEGNSLLHCIANVNIDRVTGDKNKWGEFVSDTIIQHPELINFQNSKGEIPLHSAAASGDILTANNLLISGSNIGARDNSGKTPLHSAAKEHQITSSRLIMATFLSGMGADKFAVDNEGNSPYVKIAGKEILGYGHQIQRTGKIPEKGIDPLNDRNFIGDQVEGILSFGKDGRPAFYNLWPKGTALKDMKEININVVTSAQNVSVELARDLPTKTCGAFQGADGVTKTTCLNDKTLEQAFTALDDDYVKMVKKYAEYFENRFGMKVNVSENKMQSGMPNIELFGYKDGSPEAAAFAKMPPKESKENVYGSGHILVNVDLPDYNKTAFIKLESKPDRSVKFPNRNERLSTFAHEFLHNFGLSHPHDDTSKKLLTLKGHDEARLRVSEHSVMSYGHQHFLPADTADLSTIEWLGPMDLQLRSYMPNPPPLSKKIETYNLGGVDAVLHPINSGENLPSFSILHEGTAKKMSGMKTSVTPNNKSRWNLEIDANNGYCGTSEWQAWNPNTQMHTSVIRKLPVCFLEGTVNEIQTYNGNDKITLTEGTNQFLDMGGGHNEVRLLYRNVGNKVIQTSGGFDELYIEQSVLQARKIVPAFKKGMFVLDLVNEDGTHGGSITLPNQLKGHGKGIEMLNIINEDGSITRYPVGGLHSVQEWRAKVTLPLNTHFLEKKLGLSGAEKHAEDLAAPNHGLAQKMVQARAGDQLSQQK